MQTGTKERNPTLALALAAVALALLIGLPFVMEPPETTGGLFATAVAGLVLVAILVMGVAGFIRQRRRPYLDSVLPPLPPRDRPRSKPGEK